MNRASRAASVGLSIYAGLLAILHGVFEILQGGGATEGLMIQAMGPACQADAVWHACLPAMTIIPSYSTSGFVVILLAIGLVVWSLVFAGWKYGSLGLFVLSLGLLPVGGGFVPVWIGLLGAVAATQVPRRKKESPGASRFLAALWPWTLLVLLAWFPLSWLLGWLLPAVMLLIHMPLFILMDLLLPLFTALSAIAYDRVKKSGKRPM